MRSEKMLMYKDLNEINIDLEQYEEQYLTNYEKKKWEKRILKKMRKQKPTHKKKYLGVTAAVILATVISISTGMVSVANMPFVGGMIEEYIGSNEQVDYATYKTAIGTTAENEYGKLTLNEVLIDGGRLLISSTFEPAEGIDFDYKMNPMPKVLINGENLTSLTGGQSVEINDSMYTIYNDVEITDIPIGETIRFHIEYDRLDLEMPIDNPWIFDIDVPTEQLAASSETIAFNQEIQLGNGQSIRLEKMIVTPISTILYYDWPEQANHIAFKIVSESGAEILPNSMAIDPEESYNRYTSIDLQAEKYYLVPFETSANPHATKPGKVMEQSILINP
ncbi:hypothetical protein CVD25_14595 [Bacillus canaveralius]|uniref:DUF4179 domain-containing protein n=2 Tax=Bacillus canaveralius TaxID=1403243 RepID=A0A2N5GHT1_9BACI|nr:hypothetical protein CU635_18640 [Bacillus canaveralius]PLR95448.1 hypothetical protein CVD25_14595 [Bacillus canaveralius]RSK48700.1 DUF4179 domain-containing protein [Bacillus canaveralius]